MEAMMMESSEIGSHRDAVPDYLADDPDTEPSLPDGGSYADVDVGKLQREREAREHQQSFGQRAKRGELGVTDVPGASLAKGGLYRLVALVFSPVQMIFSSMGTLAATGVPLVLLTLAAWALIELLQDQFWQLF